MRSLPRKENGKARTSMDEKSVRKSHGHHIPPAKGMGERALLLLGLLSLLTAADEVRHANAQHRATSDPSEGHAVETGEREVGALLVGDSEVYLAVDGSSRCGSRLDEIVIGSLGKIAPRIERIAVSGQVSVRDGKRDATGCGVVVARRRLNLLEDIGTLVETDDADLTIGGGSQYCIVLI